MVSQALHQAWLNVGFDQATLKQHVAAYWAADAVPLERIFFPSRRLRAAVWLLNFPGGGFSAGTATSFSLRINSMWEGLHI